MKRGNQVNSDQTAAPKRQRGFEFARGWEQCGLTLPQRATSAAAAYDIAAAEDTKVPVFRPGVAPTLIPTGLKVYMQPDELLLLVNRSSGAGKGIIMANGVGVIDADYYGNPENDGHFKILVFNCSDHELTIKKGDRIAQAIFQKLLLTDNDQPGGKRQGGIGSTDIDKNGNVCYNRDKTLGRDSF